MGKPFASEILALPENLRFAAELDIDILREELDSFRCCSVLICGAGGSYSAAAFTQRLISSLGIQANAISPLEFLQIVPSSKATVLVLFSASGKNKDILQVIRHASELGIKVLLICANLKSPAEALVSKNSTNRVFSFSYPAKKDGFLAVNSLAITWWIIARALGHSLPTASAVEDALSSTFDLAYVDQGRKHVCLVLHDSWAQPVAVDIESKMAEAGLCAPLICDYRQFGHGRHQWLAKNDSFSSVLALNSPTSNELSRRTLALLPSEIFQTVISSNEPGVEGTCELLLKSFAFISALGKRVNIDPGKPGVPQFGSKLYRLGSPTQIVKVTKKTSLGYGCIRKLNAIGIGAICEDLRLTVEKAGERYWTGLLGQKFDGLVLDFDGTAAESGMLPEGILSNNVRCALSEMMEKGITLGIATGRGDSCQGNLLRSFPETLWHRIAICHYNGASVGILADYVKSPPVWNSDSLIEEVFQFVSQDPILKIISDVRFKEVQITVKPRRAKDGPPLEDYLRRLLQSHYGSRIKLVASSHTFDIVSPTASKRLILDYLKTSCGCKNLLSIGDRGDLFGNDFELLSSMYSLSVDQVSSDLTSCWNFLPLNIRNCAGTAFYLERIKVKRGYFQFREI